MSNARSVSQFKTVIPSRINPFKKLSEDLINSAPKSDQNGNSIETHFISLIHASKTTLQLRQIHSQMMLNGLSSSSKITTQLISSSSRKSSIAYALSIFSNFKNPNVFLFNALIRGLCENSWFVSAIEHFRLMLKLDVRPDRLTFPFVLKSIAELNLKWAGDSVYCRILRMGLEYDDFVRVSLADMYVKVELFDHALKVFDESTERNKVESILLWNVIINGCCKNGLLKKALALFDVMPQRNIGSWNTMIDALIRNGEVKQAVEFFDRMEEKNVVSWTTIIHGLSQNGMYKEALEMFMKMVKEEGIRANKLTIVSALSACARIGALEAGKKMHDYVSNKGIQSNVAVGNALVDMYAKCGHIESASKVFGEMKEKDIRTWSVMIWGWGIHGHVEKALHYFEMMKLSGVKPDEVAFLAILTACSHAGEVDQGLKLFDSMKHDYSIQPMMKHYAVVADLYGRAGQLNEALSFIQSMPMDPDFVIWGSLFCACRARKNIEMAKFASEKLLQLEPNHPGSYVFLSNVYAGVGRWEDVETVRISMKDRGVDKDPGWSSIEVDGKVHNFVAGDHSHPRTQQIYSRLAEIIIDSRRVGYMPETVWVLHNIEEEEKEDALGSHSEKLALAFGLISTDPGTILRIVKNLRICGDCHSLMKHASKICQREIVVRDAKRFHHFNNGVCSCQDYW